jgi:hypothetical protein
MPASSQPTVPAKPLRASVRIDGAPERVFEPEAMLRRLGACGVPKAFRGAA